MNKTIEKFYNRKILIWGYGREGKSTERFLKTYCKPAAVEIYEGARGGVRDAEYDYVFVSPGIPFEEDAPAFDNPRFTSQTEVFLEAYGAQTVGITGTKGKSTTCSLLYTVLSACTGKKTILMGNIGKPCLDCLPQMDEETIAVFELSCHQCQRLQAAPHIAVFLNLYGDHLDRYHTMEHYLDAKCGITRHQTEEDILLLGQQVPEITTRARRIVIPAKAEYQSVIAEKRQDGLCDGSSSAETGPAPADRNGSAEVGPAPADRGGSAETGPAPADRNGAGLLHAGTAGFDLRIPGAHNQLNAQFVYEIAVQLFGCEESAVRAAMATFAGLPHRLEHCGTIGGVDWYDDSISTIPQATIQAVTSVPHARTVLVGGMDRGIDYTVLEDFIRAHPELTFILAYASGARILREMTDAEADPAADAAASQGSEVSQGSEASPETEGPQQSAAGPVSGISVGNVRYVEDLAAQVRLAREITPPGGAVIMSNAAASYGYFKDFEARGEAFRQLIREP